MAQAKESITLIGYLTVSVFKEQRATKFSGPCNLSAAGVFLYSNLENRILIRGIFPLGANPFFSRHQAPHYILHWNFSLLPNLCHLIHCSLKEILFGTYKWFVHTTGTARDCDFYRCSLFLHCSVLA